VSRWHRDRDTATPGAVSAGGRDGGELRGQVRDFLAAHDPAGMDRLEFLQARFNAGLAWVHYPEGLGGQGLSRRCRR